MLIVAIRTFILYGVVLLAVRVMGKSELSRMSPFQMVISFMIAELAAKNTADIFEELFRPIRKLAWACGTLQELKEVLEDEGRVLALYEEMDVTDLRDMLHQGMYLAELIGRVEEP